MDELTRARFAIECLHKLTPAQLKPIETEVYTAIARALVAPQLADRRIADIFPGHEMSDPVPIVPDTAFHLPFRLCGAADVCTVELCPHRIPHRKIIAPDDCACDSPCAEHQDATCKPVRAGLVSDPSQS